MEQTEIERTSEREVYDHLALQAAERRREIGEAMRHLRDGSRTLAHFAYLSLAGLLAMGLWWTVTGSRPSQGLIEFWMIASAVTVGHQYLRVLVRPSHEAMVYLPILFEMCERTERDVAMARQQLATLGNRLSGTSNADQG